MTPQYPNRLKEKHLRARTLAAKNEKARMLRVSIDCVAWDGRQVAALRGCLTGGRARTTLGAD
jgi:hypothetical protein